MRKSVYTASKTKHAHLWLTYRQSVEELRFTATWVDEAGEGQTADWNDLWNRCLRESAQADFTLVYAEEGDVLKGALAEAGSALSHGKRVIVVCSVESLPLLGSWYRHSLVTPLDTLDEAFALMREESLRECEKCTGCGRYVASPCHDWQGYHEGRPWDSSCRDLLSARNKS